MTGHASGVGCSSPPRTSDNVTAQRDGLAPRGFALPREAYVAHVLRAGKEIRDAGPPGSPAA
jgi:hypothetical protein